MAASEYWWCSRYICLSSLHLFGTIRQQWGQRTCLVWTNSSPVRNQIVCINQKEHRRGDNWPITGFDTEKKLSYACSPPMIFNHVILQPTFTHKWLRAMLTFSKNLSVWSWKTKNFVKDLIYDFRMSWSQGKFWT